MIKNLFLIAWLLFGLLFLPGSASAYPVGPALTLAEIAAQSDLIVKAQVISSNEAQDSWLGTMPGATVEETHLKIISALKGGGACPVISFRHYKEAQTRRFLLDGPGPLCFNLEPGRTYLLFAKATGTACAYRQIWKIPPGIKNDQGVVLCADTEPLVGQDLRAIVWHELTGLLRSRHTQDELYAIHQLDSMSNDLHAHMTLSEFDRDRVLTVIAPLLPSADPEVTKAALLAVAGRSLYLYDETGTHWTPRRYLAAQQAIAATPYSLPILSLADRNPDVSVRVLAIRSLGAIGAPNLEVSEVRWAGETQPPVRGAAALLLAADSTPIGQATLGKLSRDPQPSVKMSVARGIELAQDKAELPLLTALLHDADLAVREAAASSLASFPVGQTRDILQANSADPEFKSIFLDVLAEDDSAPYLDGLAEVIEKRLVPPLFSGNLPDAEAWQILFKSLGSQSQAALTSAKWGHYMDVLETAEVWSSSEPRDLYAFYVARHMTDRARKFRQASKTLIPFDMEYYYREVDKEAAATH